MANIVQFKNWQMKNIYLIIIALLLTSIVKAQDCRKTLFLKEGNILEYTQYNKKGKAVSKATHETISVIHDLQISTATIKVTSEDIKGKDSFTTEYNATCREGLFTIDMDRFFDLSKLQEYEDDMIVEITGNVLEFPKGAVAGDKLNDGSITVRVANEGFTVITMIMDVKNRKVHQKESITTTAGTFNCRKVTFDFYSKVGILRFQGSGTEWYQDDKVLVKSESYNKRGKLISSAELTEIREK